MNLKDLLQYTHQILNDVQIDHALIGGIALGARGVQRFTNDIDFLVSGDDRLALKAAFLKHGFRVFFESEEVMQFDGVGNVDTIFANRSLSKAMLESAESLPHFSVKCVSTEALIGLKIQAYMNDPKREFQDKADIQALIASNASLNWQKVEEYAELFQQWQVIREIKEKLGK